MRNKTPKLTIKNLIPSLGVGGCDFGFLFGAGSSFEAGYPLTMTLTKSVISKLTPSQVKLLKQIFDNYNKRFSSANYSIEENLPDIEIILNLVNESQFFCTDESDQKIFEKFDFELKELVVSEILLVKEKSLIKHIGFLTAIKRIIGNKCNPFWVFTTNYDLLFENAAMYAKISIRNGFEGCGARYFDINRIKLKVGKITQAARNTGRFEEYKEPYMNIIKLHGSISWYKMGNNCCEVFEKEQLESDYKRILIHPQSTKITQTFAEPYDQLFNYANSVIGNDCKYLVTCGYSYRDKHINDRLLFPKLNTGSLRIFALFEDEPENIEILKAHGNAFNYLSKNKLHLDGIDYDYPNELWKFSNFVDFISK